LPVPLLAALIGATGLVVSSLLTSVGFGQQASVGETPAIHQADTKLCLRVTWSLEQAVQWSGTAEGQQAVFTDSQNLCLSADSTGAFHIAADPRRFFFRPRGLSQVGGFDLTVNGQQDALVTFTFEAAASTASALTDEPSARRTITQTLKLADLLKETSSIEIPGLGSVTVRRRPGDQIRADFSRDALVFWAAENTPTTVHVQPAERLQPDETLDLRLNIRAARTGRLVQQQVWAVQADRAGKLPAIETGPLTMPSTEGAYNFEWRCVRPRKTSIASIGSIDLLRTDLGLLRGEQILAHSVTQVVVVERTAPTVANQPFRTVGKIQPLRRSWSIPRLLTTVPRVLPINEEPVSSGPLGEERHAGEAIAVIAPGGWYACPLPIEKQGQPHLLVIRYPAGQPMHLGVSVVQPDAAGNIVPLGTDSGVAASVAVNPVDASGWSEHRVLFWPQTRKPFVVLANHEANEPVRFESIRVEAGPAMLAGANTSPPVQAAVSPAGEIPSADDAAMPSVLPPPGSAPNLPNSVDRARLAALYLDKPLLAECFGDEGFLDTNNGVVLDDWTTFLTAGQRLVDYLKWAGYNGVILTASSEGGTLYPSRRLATTPRFDNGRLSSVGYDPHQKDVLELLMRLFDRAGLQLVPALELDSPTTQLEAVLSSDNETGIRPTDALGRPNLAPRRSRGEGGSYYNPLHSVVQAELLQSVQELTARYRDHRSFSGVALHLGPHSYAQLPHATWTQDKATLRRFATSLNLSANDEAAVAKWANGEGEAAFTKWRTAEITHLYARLATAIERRSLLLLTADCTGESLTSQRVGLDWNALGQIENVVGMRLIRESVFRDAVQQADDAKHNEDMKWDHQLATAQAAGGLVYRPVADFRLADLQQHAPTAAGAGRSRWYVHAVPEDQRYRHQLIRTMDQFDAQVLAVGGLTVPLGQEAATRDVLQTFTKLPAQVMTLVPAAGDIPSNVRLRQSVQPDATIVSALNVSPWPISIDVDFGKAFVGQDLLTSQPLRADRTFWRTTLQPGQLTAIRLSGAMPVRLWSERPDGGPEFLQSLGDRVQNLAARVALLATPRAYPALRNGSFDELSTRSIPGWMHAQFPANCVQVASQGSDDDASVMMSNDGSSSSKTWIVSVPFKTPATGRLAVSLQARCEVNAPSTVQPSLRVAIEGRVGEEPLRRSVTLLPKADGNWQSEPLWLEVEDLGGEAIEELRLTIDLLTPGRIWIDDVRLYDFFLTKGERSALQSQAFLAVQRMRQGDMTAAAKLFDSHWGRYLMGLRVPAPADAASETIESRETPEKDPASIAERLKGWLPGPLQF